MSRRFALLLPALWIACLAATGTGRQAATASSFAAAVARLSEPGGYFDTDNLISNEGSYLQVVPELNRQHVRGGAYIGVGPDQNFTYIAATRPAVAYIVDIRRDNVLLHLLFKALFHESRTRVDYLSMLFGRSAPRDIGPWRLATADRLVKYVEEAPREDAAGLHARLERIVRSFGVPLSAEDLRTIAGFHQRFIDAGLGLRFESTGRPPQWGYPTYGQMIVDTDASGRQTHFLASEEAFQFLRDLQGRDLVIPLVGDLSGPSALANVGKAIAARGDRLSAFYVSNVEFYLFREGTFDRFVANLRRIPHAGNAVLIRSFFGRVPLRPARPGDNSVSQVQRVDDLLNGVAGGTIRTYSDLAR
jgi:hypothetical protein